MERIRNGNFDNILRHFFSTSFQFLASFCFLLPNIVTVCIILFIAGCKSLGSLIQILSHISSLLRLLHHYYIGLLVFGDLCVNVVKSSLIGIEPEFIMTSEQCGLIAQCDPS